MKKMIHSSIQNFLFCVCAWLISCFCFNTGLFAQAPQALNYQAVARNAGGAILASQSATVRFTIHDASSSGTILYRETQSVNTNPFGLFTTNVGNGTVITGTFSGIDWSLNLKFLQVELDLGSGFVDMGTSQLLSVPYALNSLKSDAVNGTTSYVPRFYSPNTLGNSAIFDGGGLIGIGTTSPSAFLSIDDGSTSTYGLRVFKNGSQENAIFIKDNPASMTSNVLLDYNNAMGMATLESHSGGDGPAGMFIADGSGMGINVQTSGAGTAASIYSGGTGNALLVTSNNSVATAGFTQSGTGSAGYFSAPSGNGLVVEYGKVGIGTNTPGYHLDVEDGSSASAVYINKTGIGYCLEAITSTGAEAIDAYCGTNNGTAIYSVCNTGTNAWGFFGGSNDGIGGRFSTTTGTAGYFNGNIAGTGTFTYTSDAKLKKNIQPMSGIMNKIMQLKPSLYQYRVGEFGTMTLATGTHFGLIAQDLQKVFPDLVKSEKYTNKDSKTGNETESVDYLSVNYNELIPVLIKGMQEQQAAINNLKAEVQALKMKLSK